jgi:hypothetical protein
MSGVQTYEQRRDALKRQYAAWLKGVSITDPDYGRIWNERIDALQALDDAHREGDS